MKTIAQEFDDYIKKVYPKGTIPDQLRQLKQSWYAGSVSTLMNVVEMSKRSSKEVA